MQGRVLITLTALVVLGGAAAQPAFAEGAPPGGMVEVTEDAYRLSKGTHGVVVMAVGWGRQWKFCGADNVQLRTFAFDRVPVEKRRDKDPADLVLEAPASLLAGPGTVAQYALLVEPGEYALSYSELKVARSVNDVDTYAIGRKKLIEDGNSRAGSFTVGAGEVVYVGHFALECVDGEPMIWRYYIEGRAGFQEYVTKRLKPKYPFLDTEAIQYRLFRTSAIGSDYELQCRIAPSDPQARSETVLYDAEDCVAK